MQVSFLIKPGRRPGSFLKPLKPLGGLVGLWLASTALAVSAAESASYTFQADVMAPMRDGTQLAANLFLPKSGGPFPVVLMRTPYGKPGDGWGEAGRYAAAGYAMVVQDCRGKGASEGLWDPFRYDGEDGYDTQEWVGRQQWCNGRIGTAGGSYVGWTQWAAAPNSSRFLKAMVPVVPFGDVYSDIAYPGGAFQLSLTLGWGALVGGIQIPPAHLSRAYEFLPLSKWDDQFDREVFYLSNWVHHATYDDYWRQRGIQDQFESITVPILNVGGWYDIFSKTTIDLIDQVRDRSRDRLARRSQFVVIGPWGHGPGKQTLGELDYGSQARLDVGALQFKWFEYWLNEKETGVEDWPAYQLFVMGENVWRGENEWPLARTKFTPYYLHSGGRANGREGDGTLSLDSPAELPGDTFEYDPNNPVPTKGGNNLIGAPIGPYDQSELELRKDILVYSTPPLAESVEVTGPVKMVLYAASSARDTDFTAKLVDVHPDGKAFNLCDGIIRARYRHSKTELSLIEPGNVYRYEIDLWATSNRFAKGHRIRVEISSGNFPRFDRNPNSGQPFGSDVELLKATQTIHHDTSRPSHLLLPVIPEG